MQKPTASWNVCIAEYCAGQIFRATNSSLSNFVKHLSYLLLEKLVKYTGKLKHCRKHIMKPKGNSALLTKGL